MPYLTAEGPSMNHVTATRRTLLCTSAALSALLGLMPVAAQAQAWPNKPVRWVVAYPAGGGSDFLARQLAPQLGKQLGQTIVIDNRPGAAGMIGTDNAAKSPPDGYTIVTGDNGAMVFHSAMYRRVPYDPQDLMPIGFMARFPLILAVNPASGFTSAKQLIEELKKYPGKYSYASPGVGSPHHLAMELFKDRTNTFVVHVPYRGTAMAVQDVIGGQVPMMVLDTAAGLPQIKAGKIKAGGDVEEAHSFFARCAHARRDRAGLWSEGFRSHGVARFVRTERYAARDRREAHQRDEQGDQRA
jgi:tripartite-type tricarboxylate transporter receptor subunit TctC